MLSAWAGQDKFVESVSSCCWWVSGKDSFIKTLKEERKEKWVGEGGFIAVRSTACSINTSGK